MRPGFDADHVLTFSVGLADSIASDDAKRVLYQKRLVDAVSAIPGVDVTGFANRLPLTGCCLSVTISRDGHPIESRAVERTSYVVADPGFFRAMKIPLRLGRFLTEADTSEDPLHVVLNQAAATRYWAGENPIDGFGRFGGATGTRFQVVGVVATCATTASERDGPRDLPVEHRSATAVMRFAVARRCPPIGSPDVRRASVASIRRCRFTVQTLDEIVRDRWRSNASDR